MWSPVTWEIGLGHCQMAAGKKHWRLNLESWRKGARGSVLLLHPGKPHLLRIVIQMLSSGLLFATPWNAIRQASLSFTISHEFAQTHVHWVSDAIEPSHPLLLLLFLPSIFPSIRVFFSESALCIRWPKYWSFSLASVLPMNTQDWFFLGLTGLIPFLFKGLSRVFSSTTIKKHQLFGAQPSLRSNSHIQMWLLEKP